MARRGLVLFRLLPHDLTIHAQRCVVPSHLGYLLNHHLAQTGRRHHLDVIPQPQQSAQQGAGLRDLDPHPRQEGEVRRLVLDALRRGDGADPQHLDRVAPHP